MKFYGQFDPPVDRFIFERYFKNFKGTGFYIECGAFDGVTESSCKFFEETLGWVGVNIEASPDNYAALVQNRPDSNNLHIGLAAEKGTLTFTDVNHPNIDLFGNGSFSHTDRHKDLLDQSNCEYVKKQVEVIAYRDLVDLVDSATINLMVLDVEGYELEVLKGMEGAKKLPQILCVEHGQLGEETLRLKVEPLGYIFDTISHVNSFYIHKSIYPYMQHT